LANPIATPVPRIALDATWHPTVLLPLSEFWFDHRFLAPVFCRVALNQVIDHRWL